MTMRRSISWLRPPPAEAPDPDRETFDRTFDHGLSRKMIMPSTRGNFVQQTPKSLLGSSVRNRC
jgi:hypothetical protein